MADQYADTHIALRREAPHRGPTALKRSQPIPGFVNLMLSKMLVFRPRFSAKRRSRNGTAYKGCKSGSQGIIVGNPRLVSRS